jgi:inward rectifier potassium channel
MLRKIRIRPLDNELGFGKSGSTSNRLMNNDGSFNVDRDHLNWWDNTYHMLVTMPWIQFFLLILISFVGMNTFFALVYCLLGVHNFNGIEPGNFVHNFMQAYFFSSQTLTTVGYGHISPASLSSNIFASFESFLGLLTFAMISGLLYGRFSRPTAKIVFSENMLIAPYKGGRAIMFRMVNARRSELIETEVQLLLTINQRDENDQISRKFYALDLEIGKISFFSMSWTIVHELNERSPLAGFTQEDLVSGHAEWMVLVKGIDEVNQQMVHARHSYVAEDVVWNARFLPIIDRSGNGRPKVKTRQIGMYELLEA